MKFIRHFDDIAQQWKRLESLEQLEQAIKSSNDRPVAIFKHSTSCSRSAHAKFRLTQAADEMNEHMAFYYLDLLRYREISNAIAQMLGLVHQSPQLIVISKEEVRYHASHESISASKAMASVAVLKHD